MSQFKKKYQNFFRNQFWVQLGLVFAVLFSASNSVAEVSIRCEYVFQHAANVISQSRLLAKVQPRTKEFNKDTVPHINENIRRVLLPSRLVKTDLPYETGLRPPLSLSPAVLLSRAERLIPVSGLQITDILIGSEKKGAMFSLVRLGFLADGRPVAVKTMFRNSYEKIRNEVRGASILSDLGVFPLFHGVWYHGQEVSLVMDIVPGELQVRPNNPSLTEIQNLVQIFTRLTTVGIFKIPDSEFDLQYIRSEDQNLLFIDADGYYDKMAQTHSQLVERIARGELITFQDQTPQEILELKSEGYDWSQYLAKYIAATDEKTMLTILRQLKSQGGLLWQETIETMGIEIMTGFRNFPKSVQKFVAEN